MTIRMNAFVGAQQVNDRKAHVNPHLLSCPYRSIIDALNKCIYINAQNISIKCLMVFIINAIVVFIHRLIHLLLCKYNYFSC